MEETDEARLKRYRGAWGWVVAVIWLLLRYIQLHHARELAMAQPCPESLVGNVGDFLFGKGHSCQAKIDGDFNGGMLLAIALSPLSFLAVRYYAKHRLSEEKASEEKEAARNDAARREAHQAALADMSEKGQQERAVSLQANNRFEVITRLGAVDDQLVVLESEANPENLKLIKLNIGQSIRDIHAKFSERELAALYADDAGLRNRVERTLAEMQRLELGRTRFYADLSGMFQPHLSIDGDENGVLA